VSARVVLVMGAADAGKTTFIAWLANLGHARGLRVAIVDADIGQSEIGPPGTVGLGAVERPLVRPRDASLIALEFVGATSPGKQPWRTADATGKLATRARSTFDRVLVDTSGFVAGGFAAAVKARKIAATDPDLVVVIQADDESEHLVGALAGRTRPRVVRLPAVVGAQPRSQGARRQRRVESLARHFAHGTRRTVDAADVRVISLRGEPVELASVAPHTMVGLENAHGETLGVGLIEEIDTRRGTLSLQTTCAEERFASVRVGEVLAG
jgi:polynucleotide 5'-hydroxyl-kinase GRC3/NOL9